MCVPDPRRVWVVHGRNIAARTAMFRFLQSLDLDPIEWNEAIASTGGGAPFIGEILDRAFEEAHAVIVLLTGDDMAYLRSEFANADDAPTEMTPTPQARPNVLFEAGMAFGRLRHCTLKPAATLSISSHSTVATTKSGSFIPSIWITNLRGPPATGAFSRLVSRRRWTGSLRFGRWPAR